MHATQFRCSLLLLLLFSFAKIRNQPDIVAMAVNPIISILGFFLFLNVIFFSSAMLYAIFYSVLRSRSHKTTLRKPPPTPEAGGAWPVIGHLHLLGGPEPPFITLSKMADKYGPIFSLRLGVHPTLVVNNWEIAKECFTVNDRAFAGRPKILALEIMGYNSGMFGTSPYGPYWCHIRKITTVELLSNHRLEMLKHVRESEVKSAMKDTYNRWSELNNNNDGGGGRSNNRLRCELKKWFGDINFNVVLRMVAGKRLEVEREENRRARKALREFFKLSGEFVISDALPYLRWLDLGGKEKAMKKTAREMDEFVQFWVDEHRRNREEEAGSEQGRSSNKANDFMDVLISILDEEGGTIEGYDADTVIKATCLALILGAADTTTVALIWAVSLLLNNPQVLKKAVHELDTEIGRERLVIESDLKNLPYLQAIIKETMRLYPPTPLSVLRECVEDCTVAGYHIPSGTRLVTNISKIQRDPRVYEDPLEFKPERFLSSSHKGLDLRGQNFELIPFGAGRRVCAGISFSVLIMELSLANLLHGFDIESGDEEAVDMRGQAGQTNMKASPLHLLLTSRLPHHLYA